MHATQVLVKHLRAHCQGTHRWRMDAVIAMVESLLRGRVLTVTGLGRSLRSTSAPKHQIKKADRLVGNPHLHGERDTFYEALARLTLGALRRAVIIVDWSARVGRNRIAPHVPKRHRGRWIWNRAAQVNAIGNRVR